MRKPNYGVLPTHAVAIAAIIVGLVASFMSTPVPIAAQTPGTDLLTNGDFEYWDWTAGHWPLMMGIPEVQICPGWQAFWVQDAPDGSPMAENWKRPEFRDVKISEADYRVRSGEMAQKYFSFGGQHIAGLYQQVNGITPGTTLRFQAYIQTWGCMPGDKGWNVCPTGHLSNSPSTFHTRVGIDPTGGTDPWAGTVVWGPEGEAYDVWTPFQVDAVAQGGTVTVFTYTHVDWSDHVFRVNNDVYIDDATLVALDVELAAPEAPAAAAVEAPSEPVATAIPTEPPPTPTQRPDGSTVHVVVAGDTLLAIALAFDVDPAQILDLNNLDDNSWLSIGQELVISVDPAFAPAATPTTAAAEVIEAAGPTATPVAAIPQPTAVALVLPTPTALPVATPIPATPTPEPAKSSGGFPFIPLALSIAFGVGLGVVLNSQVKKR